MTAEYAYTFSFEPLLYIMQKVTVETIRPKGWWYSMHEYLKLMDNAKDMQSINQWHSKFLIVGLLYRGHLACGFTIPPVLQLLRPQFRIGHISAPL